MINNINKTDFLPVLIGPTAVGKTELSIRLAQALNAEIVSADSMQIYKYMDIGTAKPTLEERGGIPHHMMDLVTPDTFFTVADYQEHFEQVVQDIRARGKIPLVVGGTGLYIRVVTRKFRIPTPPADPQLREILGRRIQEEGEETLHRELQAIDSNSASRIHPHDRKRVIRALEVFLSSGRPFSDWVENAQEQLSPGTAIIGLERERDELYHRINCRVDLMMQNGLMNEVSDLLHRGYTTDLPAMQGLGYKELAPVLQGETDYEAGVELLKKRTRNYAKRQITWFRREPVAWFPIEQDFLKLLRKIIAYLEGGTFHNVE